MMKVRILSCSGRRECAARFNLEAGKRRGGGRKKKKTCTVRKITLDHASQTWLSGVQSARFQYSGMSERLALMHVGAPQWSPHTWELALWMVCFAPRCVISPGAAGEQTWCQSGAHRSRRAAPCGPCLCRGGQRGVGWRTHFGGTSSRTDKLWTRRAVLPLLSGNAAPSCSTFHRQTDS